MTSADVANALRHADDVIYIARANGFDVPEEYELATAIAAAAGRVANAPAPAQPILPDAEHVPAHCTKVAADREKHRGRVEVATELYERARLDAGRVALDAAPAVCHQLVRRASDELLPRLAELIASAPHVLSGHESAEQLALHADLLVALATATAAASSRLALAIATGENADLGHYGAAFLIIEPTETATLRQVNAASQKFAAAAPTTLADWLELRAIGVSFAEPGQAEARLARHVQLCAVNGSNTPDGGQLDHTVGELAGLVAADLARRAA